MFSTDYNSKYFNVCAFEFLFHKDLHFKLT